jgi:EmrB/QacA subfamily drug resistance transporter
VLCAAQLLLVVDVVVVNVALPAIRRSLGIGGGELQLTGVAYTLVFGSLLIVAGRLGDLLGRRRLLLAGVALFTLASLLSGGAQNGWQLFAARSVQGLGAALVSPNALALLTSVFPEGARRNQAFGMWAAVGSGGAIVGQLLGGALTALAGWRWIFLVNAPLGLAVFLAAARLLPESRSSDRRPADLLGAASLAGGLACLSVALTRVAERAFDARLGAAVALCLALAALFVSVERRHRAPLVRFGLLRDPAVRTGNLVLALNAGALTGTLFFTTLYLQDALGYSPLAVGAGFAPVTLVVLVTSPLAGRAVGRVGAPRMLVLGGTAAAAGMLFLARAPDAGRYAVDVLPGLALIALGSGLSYAPTFALGTSGVAEPDQGLASGLLSTAQELGAALGLALLASLAVSLAGDGAGFAGSDLTAYRVGYLGAGALQVLATVVALRADRPGGPLRNTS